MKALTILFGLILYSFTSIAAPVNGNLPGANLDLNAVLELFKNSKDIESFETKLNSEKTKINNLDLNEDGYVDYIRVVDYMKGNIHLITLQVAFSANDIQDVAVIQLDQADNKTVVQIVGDEALYGRDYIVEPRTDNADVAYNANNWTSVRYIYGPQYVVYISPWSYGFYPHWYRPWRPFAWDIYWGHVHHYHSYYRYCGYYRSYHAHNYYHHHKSHSPTYYNSHTYKAVQNSKPTHKKAITEKNASVINTEKPRKTTDKTKVTKTKAEKLSPGNTNTQPTRTSPTRTQPTRSEPVRVSPPKPTRTSPTRTQPTRTQPTRVSPPRPTRTSPTRTQPTRTQPTRVSPPRPTRTSPTRTQPTRTQPTRVSPPRPARTSPTRTQPTSRPVRRP